MAKSFPSYLWGGERKTPETRPAVNGFYSPCRTTTVTPPSFSDSTPSYLHALSMKAFFSPSLQIEFLLFLSREKTLNFSEEGDECSSRQVKTAANNIYPMLYGTRQTAFCLGTEL